MLTIAPHPLLDLAAFTATFAQAMESLPERPEIASLLAPGATAPLAAPNDAVRKLVRDLLRHGGFKPTGRNKPASEYLSKASEAGRLSSINPAVDIANAVSLHSGLPISVVDLDRLEPPLSVAIAAAGSSYVFNPAGQIIDVSGLLCLIDARGPCANAVKDAQRTKTTPDTRRTLSLIWGTNALPGRAAEAERWYREHLAAVGADVAAIDG